MKAPYEYPSNQVPQWMHSAAYWVFWLGHKVLDVGEWISDRFHQWLWRYEPEPSWKDYEDERHR